MTNEEEILKQLGLSEASLDLKQKALITFNKILLMKLGLFLNDSLTEQQQLNFEQIAASSDATAINQWLNQNISNGEDLFKQALEDTVRDIKENISLIIS